MSIRLQIMSGNDAKEFSPESGIEKDKGFKSYGEFRAYEMFDGKFREVYEIFEEKRMESFLFVSSLLVNVT